MMTQLLFVVLTLGVLGYSAGFISPRLLSQRIHHEATANSWAGAFQPSGVFRETLQAMIQRQNLRENFLVVVTGATGGIGSAIVQTVLSLNGLVVAIDCDSQALMNLRLQEPDKIQTFFADFKDLNSVNVAANSILKEVSQIDILVNNAGKSYMIEDYEIDKAGVSKQGYDELFQINYLSHFLLTKKLLPKMDSGRIVQVTSGLSWGVDGSGLIPSKDQAPPASHGTDRLPCHISNAYGNSKLAQIWHATHLNRLGVTTAVCACPSWAATGIAGQDKALEILAFPTTPQTRREIAGPGVKSILNAMFLPKEELDPDVLTGEKLIGNSRVLDWVFPQTTDKPHPILTLGLFGRAKMMLAIAAYAVLIFQRWSHDDLIFQKNSYESRNKDGQIALYEWSERVTSQWVSADSKSIDKKRE